MKLKNFKVEMMDGTLMVVNATTVGCSGGYLTFSNEEDDYNGYSIVRILAHGTWKLLVNSGEIQPNAHTTS